LLKVEDGLFYMTGLVTYSKYNTIARTWNNSQSDAVMRLRDATDTDAQTLKTVVRQSRTHWL